MSPYFFMSFTPTLHSLSCFYELAPLKSDEKPSIPVYVVRKHASGCGQCNSENLLSHVLTHPAQCPIFTAGPISRCTLPPCTLHIAPCTTRPILHITRLPPRWSAPTQALYSVQCTPSTQLPSPNFCQLCTAQHSTGILIKALRPFSNRKLNSPPPSQLNKKTRNTKRLKTAKVLLNCRMGNLFCRLHNIESPTSNKGGQRTLNIA